MRFIAAHHVVSYSHELAKLRPGERVIKAFFLVMDNPFSIKPGDKLLTIDGLGTGMELLLGESLSKGKQQNQYAKIYNKMERLQWNHSVSNCQSFHGCDVGNKQLQGQLPDIRWQNATLLEKSGNQL